MHRCRTGGLGLILLLALLLAGCASDTAASLLVASGDYDLYSCPQLANAAKSLTSRQHELEGLMAKAGTDLVGKTVSATTYQPEYLKVQGELHEVAATARSKQCDLSATH